MTNLIQSNAGFERPACYFINTVSEMLSERKEHLFKEKPFVVFLKIFK